MVIIQKYKYVPESFIPSLDYSNPNNALGISKKVAEFLCLNYAQKYNFETSIFRCFLCLKIYHLAFITQSEISYYKHPKK